MRNIILIVFSLCFFTACTNKYESNTPKNLIEIKQMEDILIDLYLLEASARTCMLTNQSDSLEIWIVQQTNALLKERNIEHSQFLESHTYYMGHEKLAQELMENIVNRLVKIETQAVIQHQKSEKQTDSTLKNMKSESVVIKTEKK